MMHNAFAAAPAKSGVVQLAASAAKILSTIQDGSAAPAIRAIRAEQLLRERADLCGFRLAGATSAGGSCRLLPVSDGVVALSMARAHDWALTPALLNCSGPAITGWHDLAERLSRREADPLVEHGTLLGMAIARADLSPSAGAPVKMVARGPRAALPQRAPVVLDMGTLWAGPLCGHLLERSGATVIKLESDQRSDGARHGNADFFALLNQHKRCIAIDFDRPDARALLLRLIAAADIVIESARPRALRHIGIDAEALVRQRPGLIWIAISAYGRAPEEAQRIGYGDDAAAAGGLCAALHRATGQWAFVEDAIADPLAGIHAACAAWDHWRRGQGGLIAVALRDVVAWSLADERTRSGDKTTHALARWYRDNRDGRRRAALPRRPIERRPGAVGEDNGSVAALLSPC